MIHNLSDDNVIKNHNNESKLIINYNLYGDRKPLNDQNNPDFFLIPFLILFLYGNGDHITSLSTKISLYTWAK